MKSTIFFTISALALASITVSAAAVDPNGVIQFQGVNSDNNLRQEKTPLGTLQLIPSFLEALAGDKKTHYGDPFNGCV